MFYSNRGFAAKAHYQKWYKRAYFAILDMMALNTLILWNLSAQEAALLKKRNAAQRPELKHHEFLWYISQRMLNYKEADNERNNNNATVSITTRDLDTIATSDGHTPIPCTDYNARCLVCHLDWNIEKQVQCKAKASTGEKSVKKAIYKSKRNIASKLLLCKKCGISAHPTIPQTPRHIHSIQQFQGLTCFEIAHTITGMEVWRRCDVTNTGRAYNPQMKHDVCNQLRELHGLDPTSARKRKRKERDQST
jgi:hypothetical protein